MSKIPWLGGGGGGGGLERMKFLIQLQRVHCCAQTLQAFTITNKGKITVGQSSQELKSCMHCSGQPSLPPSLPVDITLAVVTTPTLMFEVSVAVVK